MAGSDQSPAVWDITGTSGDTLAATAFTLTEDGSPLVPVSAVAQVRQSRSRSSTLILELTCDLASNVVTVGDGDDLSTVDPGVYRWDLQITNAAYPSGLTLIGGVFRVLADVSEVEV